MLFSLGRRLPAKAVWQRCAPRARGGPCLFNFSCFTTASSTLPIGFVGLGTMGGSMAANLLRAGKQLVVYDLSNEAVNVLAKQGAEPVSNVKDLAKRVTSVVSMLPTPDHVRAVYMGPEGILQNMETSPDGILIDCSTIGPVASREVISAAGALGHQMIDAPVSGGFKAAAEAALTFMVGANSVNFEKAQKILQFMGKSVFHCGEPTLGQAVKVCNNIILAASMLGVAEGFRLAEALGVDVRRFAKVVSTSSGSCWSSEVYNPVPGLLPNNPPSKNYQGGFATRLMVKDLRLALDAARGCGLTAPTTEASTKAYDNVIKKGHGELDFSCVYVHNV